MASLPHYWLLAPPNRPLRAFNVLVCSLNVVITLSYSLIVITAAQALTARAALGVELNY
jgi:hypothetical protein